MTNKYNVDCWIARQSIAKSPSDLTKIPSSVLLDDWSGHVLDDNHYFLNFGQPCATLSSAIANGGLTTANGFINARVTKDDQVDARHPALFIDSIAKANKIKEPIIGMMTAASMKTLHITSVQTQDTKLICCITVGLSNARRAGDPADIRQIDSSTDIDSNQIGTINILFACSRALSVTAQVELISLIAEAKAAALQDAAIPSPISGAIATGTGTDSTAVVCPRSSPTAKNQPIMYAGKHTLLGELTAQLVIRGLLTYTGTRGSFT